MTDQHTLYRVAGWLRLVPGDCVGVAVFSDGSNMQFLPETDDRLRILEFHPFFNEEGYTIERGLPHGADATAYSVGSGVPIPFAKGGLTIIADSGGGSSAFLEGQERGDPMVNPCLAPTKINPALSASCTASAARVALQSRHTGFRP